VGAVNGGRVGFVSACGGLARGVRRAGEGDRGVGRSGLGGCWA